MYTEEEYLMISGMQHFAFCRRQWALIHIDCVWQENRLTAEGELLHKMPIMIILSKSVKVFWLREE